MNRKEKEVVMELVSMLLGGVIINGVNNGKLDDTVHQTFNGITNFAHIILTQEELNQCVDKTVDDLAEIGLKIDIELNTIRGAIQ